MSERAGVVEDRLSLDQQVCFDLVVAARDIVSLYRPLLEPLGLTHPQYLVMVSLWQQRETLCVKDLSSLLKLEPTSLSPLLKRLHAAGLIARERDPADERSVQITVTARGWDLRRLAADIPAAVVERLGMTLEELESLHRVLLHFIARADARRPA